MSLKNFAIIHHIKIFSAIFCGQLPFGKVFMPINQKQFSRNFPKMMPAKIINFAMQQFDLFAKILIQTSLDNVYDKLILYLSIDFSQLPRPLTLVQIYIVRLIELFIRQGLGIFTATNVIINTLLEFKAIASFYR